MLFLKETTNYLRYHFNADILLELEKKYPQLELAVSTKNPDNSFN